MKPFLPPGHIEQRNKAQKRTGFKTRMHSSMMRTDRRGVFEVGRGLRPGGPCLRGSLSWVFFHVGEGGSLSRWVSIQRVSVRGLSPGVSVHIGEGVSVQGASLSGETPFPRGQNHWQTLLKILPSLAVGNRRKTICNCMLVNERQYRMSMSTKRWNLCCLSVLNKLPFS